MRMQRDTLLGLVFFAGLAGLGWATIQLTDLSLFGEPVKRTDPAIPSPSKCSKAAPDHRS